MKDNNILLDVKNLSVSLMERFSPEKNILKDINFSLNEKETIGIVGESGSGKTMTVLSILKLLPAGILIRNGEINFLNKDLIKTDESEMQEIRGNKISIIFQEPSTYLNPVFTIGYQIAEVIITHNKIKKTEANLRTIELLRAVGMPSPETIIKKYPFEISGGQKQRAMIALAIASNPKIIIADEPTTSLDVTIQAQILEVLKSIKKNFDTSIIFITHDFGIVKEIADRILVLYQGKIVEEGRIEDIFKYPKHPYTISLLKSAGLVENNELNEISEKNNLKLSNFKVAKSLINQATTKNQIVVAQFIEPNLIESTKNNDILLDVKNVKIYFPIKKGILKKTAGFIKAVDNVDLYINKNETVGLIGESGCGKSTLGKGIIKLNEIYEGNILFNNKNIVDNKKFVKGIAMAFQDPISSLNPKLKIKDIIIEGLPVYDNQLNMEQINTKLVKIILLVGLDINIINKYPHEFSGGQRQRIALARALILEPEIIILDEISSSLDVTIKTQILKLLKDIQKKTNVSYLFISHDLMSVENMADRIYVMYLGRIVEYGTKNEIFNFPKHPYTRALLSSVLGFNKEKKIILSGDVPNPASPPTGCHFNPRCSDAMDKCKIAYPDISKISLTHSVKCYLYP